MAKNIQSYSYQASLALAQLFQAAETLVGIKTFYIGEPLFIPQAHYPCLICAVNAQTLTDKVTGIHYYTYTGLIAVEAQVPDRATQLQSDNNRLWLVDSYYEVNYYLDLASTIVEQNRNLSALTTDEGEKTLAIYHSNKTYFTNARLDGFTDRGQFTISLDTQKNEVIL